MLGVDVAVSLGILEDEHALLILSVLGDVDWIEYKYEGMRKKQRQTRVREK